MFLQNYREVAADDQSVARQREYQVMNRVVGALEGARGMAPTDPRFCAALDLVVTVWSVFIDDLSKPDNRLPDELRARLLSVGLWVMRRAGDLRFSAAPDLAGLIEVNANIRDGLR